MSLTFDQHILGRQKRMYAALQTTDFKTPATIASTDAFKVLDSSIGFQQNRINRDDARDTRSLIERIDGLKTTSWSLTSYLIPSGVAGTAPDMWPLLRQAFGAEAGTTTTVGALGGGETSFTVASATHFSPGSVIDVGSSVGHRVLAVVGTTITVTPSILGAQGSGSAVVPNIVGLSGNAFYLADPERFFCAVTLEREFLQKWTERLVGAWVETFTLSLSGAELPTVELAGSARKHIRTGFSGIAGGGVSGAAITVDNVELYDAGDGGTTPQLGSLVEIVDGINLIDNNGGAGFEVESIAGNVLTLSGAPSGALDTHSVAPLSRTQVTAGSPVPGISGSLLFGTPGAQMEVTGVSLTITNNMKPRDDESFTAEVPGYIPGFREVTGEISFRMRRDVMKFLARRKTFVAQAVTVNFGALAGKRAKLTIPKAELEFAAPDIPQSEEGIATLPFRALSSGGATPDEVVLSFD